MVTNLRLQISIITPTISAFSPLYSILQPLGYSVVQTTHNKRSRWHNNYQRNQEPQVFFFQIGPRGGIFPHIYIYIIKWPTSMIFQRLKCHWLYQHCTCAGTWLGVVYAGLEHKNFVHENLFSSRIWQNCEIFNP